MDETKSPPPDLDPDPPSIHPVEITLAMILFGPAYAIRWLIDTWDRGVVYLTDLHTRWQDWMWRNDP